MAASSIADPRGVLEDLLLSYADIFEELRGLPWVLSRPPYSPHSRLASRCCAALPLPTTSQGREVV
jgi:hypothetical protein